MLFELFITTNLPIPLLSKNIFLNHNSRFKNKYITYPNAFYLISRLTSNIQKIIQI
jgi:hypothetical protein